MVPAGVWDVKHPTGRPSRGLEIDVSVAVGGLTNGLGPSRNGFCVTEANCRVPSSIRWLYELHMVSEDVLDGQYSLGSSSGGLEINYYAR